jgi:hypothetical protein
MLLEQPLLYPGVKVTLSVPDALWTKTYERNLFPEPAPLRKSFWGKADNFCHFIRSQQFVHTGRAFCSFRSSSKRPKIAWSLLMPLAHRPSLASFAL